MVAPECALRVGKNNCGGRTESASSTPPLTRKSHVVDWSSERKSWQNCHITGGAKQSWRRKPNLGGERLTSATFTHGANFVLRLRSKWHLLTDSWMSHWGTLVGHLRLKIDDVSIHPSTLHPFSHPLFKQIHALYSQWVMWFRHHLHEHMIIYNKIIKITFLFSRN